MLLMDTSHAIKGLDPVADAFDLAATPASDVVNMTNYTNILFTIHYGVGATGTQTFIVEACDDVVPTNTTAIPFYAREILTGDTEATAIQTIAATGFTTTAGSSKIVKIEALSSHLAPSGRKYIRLKQSAEPVNNPCLAGISIEVAPPRFTANPNATAIV